jgi:hypothetical protein
VKINDMQQAIETMEPGARGSNNHAVGLKKSALQDTDAPDG